MKKPKAKQDTSPTSSGFLINSNQISVLFWLASSYFIFLGLHSLGTYDESTVLGYFLILGASALPIFLWIQGANHGLPIYPLFCSSIFTTFGAPLITQHPWIIAFQPEAHLSVAVTTATALSVGTALWFLTTKNQPALPTRCRQLPLVGGERILLGCLLAFSIFALNNLFNFLPLKGGTFSLIQGVVLGLNNLAVFMLSQRLGSGKLTKWNTILFLTLFAFQSIVTTASILLYSTFAVTILALAGFTIGARRIPWLATAAAIMIAGFLHIGKTEMRVKYWDEAKNINIVSVADIGPFYLDWFAMSWDEMFRPRSAVDDDEKGVSLFQRSSLIQLMLYMKDINDRGYPHLNGETYSLIPRLLVPRILNPDKPWSLEGNTLLTTHYGLQTREDTLITTIGFGMFNEGYGNYGVLGVILVGGMMGLCFGLLGRFTTGYPTLSFRTLLAILGLSVAFQTEFTAGVLVTTLFQGLVALVAFSFIFMKNLPVLEEAPLLAPLRKKRDVPKIKNLHHETPSP